MAVATVEIEEIKKGKEIPRRSLMDEGGAIAGLAGWEKGKSHYRWIVKAEAFLGIMAEDVAVGVLCGIPRCLTSRTACAANGPNHSLGMTFSKKSRRLRN